MYLGWRSGLCINWRIYTNERWSWSIDGSVFVLPGLVYTWTLYTLHETSCQLMAPEYVLHLRAGFWNWFVCCAPNECVRVCGPTTYQSDWRHLTRRIPLKSIQNYQVSLSKWSEIQEPFLKSRCFPYYERWSSSSWKKKREESLVVIFRAAEGTEGFMEGR